MNDPTEIDQLSLDVTTMRRELADRRYGVSARQLSAFIALLFTLTPAAAGADALTADDVLRKSRAKYAALKSYADTGVIVSEYTVPAGPTLLERHTFTTYFSPPRQFFFDFKEDENAGGDRMVLWMDDTQTNSW